MQLEPSEEQMLVSSSGDRTASVWDRRKLSPGVKPLATATATNTILGAYFSPAGMPCHLSCISILIVRSLHVLACMHASKRVLPASQRQLAGRFRVSRPVHKPFAAQLANMRTIKGQLHQNVGCKVHH